MLSTHEKETAYLMEILASKICHDLVSPISAVQNGMEFLKEVGADAGDDAINLVESSASIAAARLQLFRIMYGAGGNTTSISAEMVYNTIQSWLGEGNRVVQDWDCYDQAFYNMPSGAGKILACCLILGFECLPRGGILSVKVDQKGFTVIANSPQIKLKDYADLALNGELPLQDIDANLIHSYATGFFARRSEFSVSCEEQGQSILIHTQFKYRE
jgi:histidine phosphotransferase ChpT